MTSEDRVEAQAARDLVDRITRGDSTAETTLVERYSRVLMFYLRRQVSDTALAEDLYQETFHTVLVRLRSSGLNEPEKLANFLYSTARNLTIMHFRKSARQRTHHSIEDDGLERTVESSGPSPLATVLHQEKALLVRQMITEIKSQRDREVLYRYYVAEEEKEALCKDLNLSHRHFDRVLFRARSRLKELAVRAEKRDKLLHSR